VPHEGFSSLLQDEIEFGYTHAPQKSFPVVLDSPRDGGLEHFPIKNLLVRAGQSLALPGEKLAGVYA